MNNNNHDIEKILSETSFRNLSSEEQNRVWLSVSEANKRQLSFNKNKQYMLKPILTALVIAVALGGTVALADNSLPGDPLFTIDRAVENLRLSLASEQKKNELRIAFADERVKEVEKITTVSPSMTRPASADISERFFNLIPELKIPRAAALLSAPSRLRSRPYIIWRR
jgi:hypothetical protein